MSDGSWWNDTGGGGGSDGTGDYQYNPTQTATGPELLNANTAYSPPGEANPIDQYNYVADPNAAGGWLSYPPGVAASADLATFSNNTGQFPNDAEAANAIGNSIDTTPTVDMGGNAAFLQDFLSSNTSGGWGSMSPEEQQTWYGTYGQQAAPYVWAQQAGLMQGAPEGFNALPQDQQNTWYGTYGQYAPQVWQQQAAANGGFPAGYDPSVAHPVPDMTGTWGPNGFRYGASLGNYPGTNYGTPWNNPMSIGAGTSEIPYGWGVPGFGQDPFRILPDYMQYLSNPAVAPGYIPGSGTYNQAPLNQPGLFGTFNNQPFNAAYGSGGVGDPVNGVSAPRGPDFWTAGPQAFQWEGNMGDTAATEGFGAVGNLFGRVDAGTSGISHDAAAAPQVYYDMLYETIRRGVTKPTAFGWRFLQETKGITPQQIGGAAPAQAQSVGVGPGGGGAATTAGNGPMGAGTQAFNYQAAYLDYLTARMNQLEIPGMENQDERARDALAFEQAKQKWLESYQQQQYGEAQRQFDLMQGIRTGQLTGMYNGQKTLQAQAQEQDTSLRYLNLLAQLRGPGDIFQYLKVLGGTPGGIRDIVNSAAGAYRMPGAGGGVTVGGYSNGADLNTLLDQINNPTYGQEGQNLNLPLPNQLNAQNLLRMSPSQRQSLLAAYESAGYRPEDVMSIFQNSLPRYAAQGGAGRVNLFGR